MRFFNDTNIRSILGMVTPAEEVEIFPFGLLITVPYIRSFLGKKKKAIVTNVKMSFEWTYENKM